MAPEAAEPVELSFREEGSGPPIVFLHGLGGDRLLWNAVVPELAGEFHVIVPNLRGHGDTGLPDGSTLSFDELERDVLAFLDRRALSSVHWVGFSAGGFLALRLALDHPERSRSLTIVSGAAYL